VEAPGVAGLKGACAIQRAALITLLAVPETQRAVRSLLNPNPFSARVSSGIDRACAR